MKKLILLAIVLFTVTPQVQAKFVNGYFRRDGTYVRPYFRVERPKYNYGYTRSTFKPYKPPKVNYSNPYSSTRYSTRRKY